MADIDLGISAADAEEWAAPRTPSYLVESREPRAVRAARPWTSPEGA